MCTAPSSQGGGSCDGSGRLEEPPIMYSRTELRRGSRYLNGWPWSGRPLLMER